MDESLKIIVENSKAINKDFEIIKYKILELLDKGATPSEESIKKAIDEVLSKNAFIKENELKGKLEKLLKELDINLNIDKEMLEEKILKIFSENKEKFKGDPFTYEDFTPEQLENLKGENGKSAYEIWLNNEQNSGKSEDEFLASLKGEKGEDGDKISDERLTQSLEEVAKPLIEENMIRISTIENNCLAQFLSALEKNAILCNVANTPPTLQGNMTGFPKGFIWIDRSTIPNSIYISKTTQWEKVDLGKENFINKLSIIVSRNNISVSYNACTISNFGLIDFNEKAIFAKSSNIGTSPSGKAIFEIDGVDYTATISSTISIYSSSYTYNILSGDSKTLLSGALSNNGNYEYTLSFDKPLPANIKGFGVRPYGNVTSRDWTPKLILKAYCANMLEPLFSLEKTAKKNDDIPKTMIYAIDITTGGDITRKVKDYSDWTILNS
ncbi:hypothetical protein [Campylobacter estrildidarum]|uniref:Phage tail protein n=1 Tax=Campylobacter estrildidarum TaxID=2510189 RepID=A0A4V6DW46_9BACT|nr:hypothetical protein [Campylobacter estrildidarum]TKX30642.1 hypothetical protein CQA69_05250 [Campylobacter estrildidarum]